MNGTVCDTTDFVGQSQVINECAETTESEGIYGMYSCNEHGISYSLFGADDCNADSTQAVTVVYPSEQCQEIDCTGEDASSAPDLSLACVYLLIMLAFI